MTVITQVHDAVDAPYRWMDQKIALRADAAAFRGELLEAKIYAQVEAILASRDNSDLSIFVGRVTSEIVEDLKDPKLPINTHSLVLEGATGRAAGRRIKLIIHECSEYILYSGQIVGAVGRVMAAGREFHADTIVCGPACPSPTASLKGSVPTAPTIHVTIASGPYSPDNMLIFDSIAELEVRIRHESPDVLFVMGPFLDISHPLVAAGTLEDSFGRAVTFEDIYKQEIIPKLARLARACENARTQLVIVPAINEARLNWPLPQPSLQSVGKRILIWEALVKELPQTVTYTSNPATVTVGDMNILVTSTDALSSINGNVLFKQGADESSLGRVDACLDQLLRARSLFPVTPSTLRIEPSMRPCLDITESDFPQIVILPSLAGKRFIKKVSGRVFVNPGFMSDATGSSSSIAEILIQPTGADVQSRVTGDLVKL
jgi:DNA polymerase alpha subunit B